MNMSRLRKHVWSCAVLAEEHEHEARLMIAECAHGVLTGLIYEDLGKTFPHKGEAIARARYLTQALSCKVTPIKMWVDYSGAEPILKPSEPCLVRNYERYLNSLENKQ